MKASRESSEKRYEVVYRKINSVKTIDDMFQVLSLRPNKNYLHNPIRIIDKEGPRIMRTTGQIVLCAKDRTLYYRPIWSKTIFDFDKVNCMESKTFFEIISSRKIFQNDTIKEQKGLSFKEMCNKVRKNGN
jgi:hypothetical protein